MNEKLGNDYLLFLLGLPILGGIGFILVSNNIISEEMQENFFLLPLLYIFLGGIYFNFIKNKK